jgi:hypothetical protein
LPDEEDLAIAPTLTLKVYEGPTYLSSDGVCCYRVKAIVSGKPAPDVEFSRDDSGGAWGSYKVQVNLCYENESYVLSASATNSEGTATDTLELSWECEIENEPEKQPDAMEYGTAFGIDYDNPDKYLAQGEQSKISDTGTIEKLYCEKKDINHLSSIYNWLTSKFSSFSAGGGHIGLVTVDQLLKERKLGGCHDHALVYAAVARQLGYPSVMLETASIPWIKQFQEDSEKAEVHKGHVFVEVYLDNNWILIDPTSGWYVKDNYDPAEPVIPLDKSGSEQKKEIYGYYAYLKGLDSWDMNIHGNPDTQKAMDETAIQIDLNNIHYPDYKFSRFFR